MTDYELGREHGAEHVLTLLAMSVDLWPRHVSPQTLELLASEQTAQAIRRHLEKFRQKTGPGKEAAA